MTWAWFACAPGFGKRSRLQRAAYSTILAVPAHAYITGKPRVIDGGTIEIGQMRVHLHGIDLPESRQFGTGGHQVLRHADAVGMPRHIAGVDTGAGGHPCSETAA